MRASWCLVYCLQMREPALVRLDEVCREHRVKLLIAWSYGLVGSLRVSLRHEHVAAHAWPAASFPVCFCLQVSLPEHRVIESKPDNSAIDLRLHAPWPELQQFADRLDLATADDVTHKHIPYGGWAENCCCNTVGIVCLLSRVSLMVVCPVAVAILLLKAASQWQSQHGSKLPQGSAQRSEFKRIIQSWQRSIDGVPIEVSCPA